MEHSCRAYDPEHLAPSRSCCSKNTRVAQDCAAEAGEARLLLHDVGADT